MKFKSKKFLWIRFHLHPLSAIGNVKLNREDIKASGDKLETSSDFKHFRLTGNAHVIKGGSK